MLNILSSLYLKAFNNFIINIIVVSFTILITTFFNKGNKFFKFIKGIITGLLIGLLMLNPISLKDGTYYDGKVVLITILGLFSGLISTITSILVAIPLRLIISETGNPLVSIFTMLSSGFFLFCLDI